MKIGTALPGASVVALVLASLLSFVPNSEAYFLFTGRIKSKSQEIDFSERPFAQAQEQLKWPHPGS